MQRVLGEIIEGGIMEDGQNDKSPHPKIQTAMTVSNIHIFSERISTMKILIIAIAISLLFWVFCVPFTIRTIARIAADKMLYGKKTPTKKCINRCIRVLTWSNEWITNNEEPDDRRIKRLRVKLNKIQKP